MATRKKTKTKTKTKARPKPKAKAKPRPKPEAKTKAKPKPKAKAKAKAKATAKKPARAPAPSRTPTAEAAAPARATPRRGTARRPEPGKRRPKDVEVPQPSRASGLPAPEWLRAEGAGAERRRFTRVRRDMRVRLFAGEGAQSYLEAQLRSADVSLSGIFLRSTFFVPEGTTVRVEVDTPWDRVLRVHGHVARVQREGAEGGFGIRFDGVDDEELEDLISLFAGERIEGFVRRFVRDRRAGDVGDLVFDAILAWELERLADGLPGE
jgi:hypothetical protein